MIWRANGSTRIRSAPKTIDGIIASACIKANLPMVFSDRDVLPYVEHLGPEAA